MVINTQFSEAESLLVNRMAQGDSSIKVFLYYASVLNSKMTHFENRLDEKAFYNALNTVIDKGEYALTANNLTQNERSQIFFYTGSAFGYLAFYQGHVGEWFSAIKNGSNARDYLMRAIDTDSTQWDAYLGLGAYKYWFSAKMHWLPFVDDERAEGIKLIQKTIEKNGYSTPMAMHQLIYILLDFGDFDQAQTLAEELIKRYPNSTFMYWAHSHVYMKKKDLTRAIESYKKLLELIVKDTHANPNHRITCLARLMDMYARRGQCDEVAEITTLIINDVYYAARRDNDEAERLLDETRKRCKN